MSTNRLDTLRKLALEYQELNGSYIETLHQPSPIEFLRQIRIARPTLIKGFCPPALRKWDDEYLIERMGENPISVAVTPTGHADAITISEDGRKYFVEPQIEVITMKDLLNRLAPRDDSAEVYYLQSQNGNLYASQGNDSLSEFQTLLEDVPKEVPWASEALGLSPDAVNLWVGNDRSITSVHSDPYENIYTVVRGTKHFTLFPPTEGWCLQERMYPHAKYIRKRAATSLVLTPSASSTPSVRWSSVQNPMDPTELPLEAKPIDITLRAGETLYLPAGWWHYVRQTGVTIALNWWYDMEARGMGWVWLNFLRGESDGVPDGNGDEGSLSC
ncbi:cupin-like domain-containing protein [Phellopilus nigrolimitatus]|nr:cupin-like domain-containing protein [Phellopilus nigrolimitatus]